MHVKKMKMFISKNNNQNLNTDNDIETWKKKFTHWHMALPHVLCPHVLYMEVVTYCSCDHGQEEEKDCGALEEGEILHEGCNS